MTPVTRQNASSIHVASHATRYDYLNAAKKNLTTTTEQQQQKEYDQECFEDRGDDAPISTRRTSRNSKVKQQQQPTPAPSKKTVAFAPQAPAQAPAQQHEQQPAGKRVSKRQAAKYDAQIEAVEAANILASLAAAAAAAAAAGPKERTPPYWTRQHEKAKSSARLQKAMTAVLQCE